MINESIVASVIQLDTEGKTMSELVASMYPLNIPAPSSMGKYTYANLLRETDFVRDQVLKRKIVKTTTSDVRDFKWLRLKSDARNPPMDTKGEPLRVVSRWWSYASRGFIKSQNNMYICWSSSSNLWPIYQVARFCHICLSVGPYIMPTVARPASAMFSRYFKLCHMSCIRDLQKYHVCLYFDCHCLSFHCSCQCPCILSTTSSKAFPYWGRRIVFSISPFSGLVLLRYLLVSHSCIFITWIHPVSVFLSFSVHQLPSSCSLYYTFFGLSLHMAQTSQSRFSYVLAYVSHTWCCSYFFIPDISIRLHSH